MTHRRTLGTVAAALAAALLPVALAAPAAAQPADAPRCQTTVGKHVAYTLLGNEFFTFVQRVDWCTRDGQVVSVGYRDHTLEDASSFAQFRGLVEDFVTPVPAPEVVSTKKATVENCIPGSLGGCLSVRYPYVKIVLHGDGTSYVLDGG